MRQLSIRLGLASLVFTMGFSKTQAQWQLPPGTSSSVEDSTAPQNADKNLDGLVAAEKRMQAQDWQGAVTALKPLCAASPRNAHALYDLGFAYEALHDEAAAKQAYEHAIAADPNAVLPLTSLGLLRAREGDAPGSTKLLRQAVALPSGADNREAQAQAYRALARLDLESAPDRSREELLAAIRLSAETADDVLLGAEIADALHDTSAADQAYRRALTVNPESTEAATHYARLLIQQEKYGEANMLLDSALAKDPDSSILLTEKAGLLVHEKKVVEALPLLQRLHKQEPGNAALTRLLARAFVAVGKSADADVLFQQLHAANPSDGEITAEWADSFIRQKRNREAEALLGPALNGHFSSGQARSHAAEELAFAASAEHDPETVLRAITIRNENLPMDAPSAFLLATAHDTLHHTSQAAGYYRQFLELAQKKYPDEEWQAQQRLQILNRAK